eukprot:3745374-Rhodomonas_salina.1
MVEHAYCDNDAPPAVDESMSIHTYSSFIQEHAVPSSSFPRHSAGIVISQLIGAWITALTPFYD